MQFHHQPAYSEGFEDIPVLNDINLIPACWHTFGSSSPQVTTGLTGRECLTPSEKCLSVNNSIIQLPCIDTSLYPLHTLQVRLSVYSGSILVGALDSLNDISQFLLAGTVTNNHADWRDYTVPLTACAGLEHVALIASGEVRIDNIIIEQIPACPRPQNLTIQSHTSSSVHLTWNVPNNAPVMEYNVTLSPVGDVLQERTFTTSDTSLIITGLTQDTRYRAHVYAVCTYTSMTYADSVDFYTAPLPCIAYGSTSDTAVIADSSNACTLSTLPYIQLITPWEICSTGLLTAIDIYVAQDTISAGRFQIMMQNCHQYSVNYNDDGRANVLVFRDTVAFHQGWNNIVLNSPFHYTGESLLIALRILDSETRIFAGHTAPYYSNTGVRTDMRLYYTPCGQADTCSRPLIEITEQHIDHTTLVWLPGNADTLWDIYLQSSADSIPILEDIAVDTNTYTFQNLTEGFRYQAIVVPYCAGTPDSTHSDTIAFTVPCNPVDSLPFFEDFENFSSFNGNEGCWSRLGSVEHVVDQDSNGLIQLLYNHSTTSHLILPVFTDQIQDLSVEFHARFSGYGPAAGIITGIMTDILDPASFIPVDTMTFHPISNADRFTPHTVCFENYAGSQGRIAIRLLGNYYNFMVNIDNVEVFLTPDCRYPDSIRLASVTPTTATFRWHGYPSASIYEIEYGRRDFTPGTGTVVTAIAADSMTITGLRSFSHYDYFVRAYCALGDTSRRTYRGSFNSGCGEIDSLPYVEDFDQWPPYPTGSDLVPPCWSMPSGSRIVTVTGIPGQPSHNGYAIYGRTIPVCTPPIDSLRYPINGLCVTFRAFGSTTLIVGTCSDPSSSSSFLLADTVHLTNEPTLYQVYFDNPANHGRYIAFQMPNYGSYTIDSLRIDVIPPCARPDLLTVVNPDTTTASIGWRSRSYPFASEVEYGLAGFTPGTGTRVVATSNPFTLTGLFPGIEYEFYVRDICGAGDTSEWSLFPGHFSTCQQPLYPPFCEDFESPLGIGQWQSVSYNGYRWCCGTHTDYIQDNHSVYISSNNGTTASVDGHNTIALFHDIDFGNDSVPLTLSFRTRTCTEEAVSYNGMYVFLVDPDQPYSLVHLPSETPWGALSEQNILYNFSANYSWINHSVDLDTLQGLYRLVFLWVKSGNRPFPVALDNICIAPSECPRPFNIECAATTTEADLVWFGDTGTLYQVRYYKASGGLASTCTSYTNNVHLTDLTPGTLYQVQIRRRCDNHWSEYSPTTPFTTSYCDGNYSCVIADTGVAVASARLPFSTATSSSYTQQIFLAQEIGHAGYITRIDFHYTGSRFHNDRSNCYLYMGHTEKREFRDSNDFVDPAQLQMVYTGSIIPSTGWFSIILETPFLYNGTDNLVFAMLDMSGYRTGRSTYSADATPTHPVLQVNLAPPCFVRNRAQLDTLEGHRTLYANRNRVRFGFCPGFDCDIPHIVKAIARPNRTNIRWRSCGPDATYTAEYRSTVSGTWTSLGTLSDTVVYIRGTIIGQDYLYRVRHNCPDTVSHWAIGHFCAPRGGCIPPEDLRPYNMTHNSATLTWEGDENNGMYYIHVFNNVYDHSDSSIFNRCRFESLEVGPVYSAVVSAFCSDSGHFSDWSDTLKFSLPACADVDSVRLVGNEGSSAILDWDGTPDAEGWIVLYGPVGTPEALCDTAIARTHPYLLRGLIPGEEYEIHIRTICSGGYLSEHWSEPLVFTSSVGIASPSGQPTFTLHPNPARGLVQVILPPASSEARIEVLDLVGRNWMVAASGDKTTVDLDLQQLPAGIYMVRVSTNDFTSVQRLIKQ